MPMLAHGRGKYNGVITLAGTEFEDAGARGDVPSLNDVDPV